MAAEIALSAQLSSGYQAGLQALKSAAQSEAAIVDLVTKAASQGGGKLSTPATDPSRAVDIIV